MEKISQYIDLQILGIGCVIFVSFIFLKVLFRHISMPKIIAIILSAIIIVGNAYMIYLYISQEESKLIETTEEYYIKGEIKFVSNAIDKIRVNYIKTNMTIQDLEDKEIFAKIMNSTAIYDRSTGKRISLNDIKSGDMVAIITTVSSLKDGKNEVIAKKIYKY